MDDQRIEQWEKLIEESAGTGIVYAPSSIWHGTLTRYHSKETLLQIELNKLRDFLDFLFLHSEHCDHISYSDAWIEFLEWESPDMVFDELKPKTDKA